MSETVLRTERSGGIARVTLARPSVRNAFDAALIAELTAAFVALDADPEVRVVVLAGEGPAFCAGADVGWMRDSLELNEAENVRDAEAWADVFAAVDGCRKPVVARVHGAAIGGGAALCACSDIVVASDETVFGFTETRLGIIPAVVTPYVLAKIGISHARRLLLSGERFDADRALAIGLVHDVVRSHALDARVAALAASFLGAGPQAVAAAKALLRRVAATADSAAARELTVAAIARVRVGAEAQEGLRAFLDRRSPSWAGGAE